MHAGSPEKLICHTRLCVYVLVYVYIRVHKSGLKGSCIPACPGL